MLSFWLFVAGFGRLYSTLSWWNEEWFLHGKLLPANKDQVWQRDYWWTGWYVWTNAWYVATFSLYHLDASIRTERLSLFWHLFFRVGSGIGTGPGVIQDHYSPTMGRHRPHPHYNGHIVNGNGSHQPQFEAGSKPFIKPSQVCTTDLQYITGQNVPRGDSRVSPYLSKRIQSPSQGHLSPVFNHKQNHLVQMQSKDVAQRFGKKGKVNADEVNLVLPTV